MLDSPDDARRIVVTSAIVVAGVWGVRSWKLSGGNPFTGTVQGVMSFGEFATAWGVTYFVLAMISETAPRVAGSLAALIMIGDLLANGKQLAALQQQKANTSAAATVKAAGLPVQQTLTAQPPVNLPQQ